MWKDFQSKWRFGWMRLFGFALLPLAVAAVHAGQPKPTDDVASTSRGQQLYRQHCADCHGELGDGQGLAAALLYPKPRNFRLGKYRLVSTENIVPTREDIDSLLVRGMPGSSMPSWAHLSNEQRQLLIDEIVRLTSDGARGRSIANLKQQEQLTDEEIKNPEVQAEIAADAMRKVTPGEVTAVPEIPPADPVSIARGKELYVKQSCHSCHGLGAGGYTWAGNYKGALFQASSWSGPGVGSFIHEDPFAPVLDETARLTHHELRHCSDGEDPSYWACGERTQTVNLPQGGRRTFTGKTHLPTPTKCLWYNNANFLNQSKWVYNIIVNVLPKMDLIIDQQIEWTGSAEYSDVVVPVNSWVEFEDYECGGSCSNPFLQVWKGGIKPVHNSIDDAAVFAGVARALAKRFSDQRFADYFKFITDRKAKVYIQRVFDNSTTTRGKDGPYNVEPWPPTRATRRATAMARIKASPATG